MTLVITPISPQPRRTGLRSAGAASTDRRFAGSRGQTSLMRARIASPGTTFARSHDWPGVNQRHELDESHTPAGVAREGGEIEDFVIIDPAMTTTLIFTGVPVRPSSAASIASNTVDSAPAAADLGEAAEALRESQLMLTRLRPLPQARREADKARPVGGHGQIGNPIRPSRATGR